MTGGWIRLRRWRRMSPGTLLVFAAVVAATLLVGMLPPVSSSHRAAPPTIDAVKAPTPAAGAVVLKAPFGGGGVTWAWGSTHGCAQSRLGNGTSVYFPATGIAKLRQKAVASNQGCNGSYAVGMANGSAGAGADRIPFNVSGGTYTVDVEWRVAWTLNASVQSRFTLYPSTECTWWAVNAALSNRNGSTIANSNPSYGPAGDPACLQGNASWNKSEVGDFHVFVNGTLAAGTYYVTSAVYIESGGFVNDPGLAVALENIGTDGNYARLLSITIS